MAAASAAAWSGPAASDSIWMKTGFKLCLDRLEAAYQDVAGAANLLWDSLSVQARFEGTGAITRETAVGPGTGRPRRPGLRAGEGRPPRFPGRHFPLRPGADFVLDDGRRLRPRLRALAGNSKVGGVHQGTAPGVPRGAGPGRRGPWPLKPDHLVVSLVEGWRGEICHVALTDGQGRFSRYKIVDPSFHNWTGLAMALRDQQISDFPLCNKSFNLSYCGHDL